MNELQQTLNEMVQSGSTNPAMTIIIHDYAKYHMVLVLLGGCLVVLFALMSLKFWTSFKRTPRINRLKWGFERKVYFYFGILSSVLALLMLLIAAANATNAFNPMHGLSLLVE